MIATEYELTGRKDEVLATDGSQSGSHESSCPSDLMRASLAK